MALLASAHERRELAAAGYHLYEEFRPETPSGVTAWGAKGCLDLDRIRAMGEDIRQSRAKSHKRRHGGEEG